MVGVSLEIESSYEAPASGKIIVWPTGKGRLFSSGKDEDAAFTGQKSSRFSDLFTQMLPSQVLSFSKH